MTDLLPPQTVGVIVDGVDNAPTLAEQVFDNAVSGAIFGGLTGGLIGASPD